MHRCTLEEADKTNDIHAMLRNGNVTHLLHNLLMVTQIELIPYFSDLLRSNWQKLLREETTSTHSKDITYIKQRPTWIKQEATERKNAELQHDFRFHQSEQWAMGV